MSARGTVEVLESVRGDLEDTLVIRGESTIPKSVPPKDISYEALRDKPEINAVEVIGQKLGIDYNLQDKMDVLTTQEIEKILYLD